MWVVQGPMAGWNNLTRLPGSQRFQPNNLWARDPPQEQYVQYLNGFVAELKQLEQPAHFCHLLKQLSPPPQAPVSTI